MKNEHPHLLLWYVSGVIGPEGRAEIEEHLEDCEGCRLEVRALASMMRSLRSQTRLDHVAADALVLYDEGALAPRGARRTAVEDHLTECGPCREDLRALGHARHREEPAGAAAGPVRRAGHSRASGGSWRGWTLAAAVAATILVGASVPVLLRPAAVGAGSAPIASAVFAAPRRGVETARTLRGPGPWLIRVVLPFGPWQGSYRVSIRPPGGAPLPGLDTVARASEEGCLFLILPALPGPGRYEMMMRGDADGSDPPLIYPFELLAPAGRQPAL